MMMAEEHDNVMDKNAIEFEVYVLMVSGEDLDV